MARSYKFLFEKYTTYIVSRKPGLPADYSMNDMAKDYAEMIKEEFRGPVDVIGVSTGGSIAQHFASGYPNLVRRLVLHSSAFTLNDEAKIAQMKVADIALQHRWRTAYLTLMNLSLPRRWITRQLVRPFIHLVANFGPSIFGAPDDSSDLIVTIKAENNHNFRDRLAEIKAPTLLIAGDKAPFYSEALFRETAAGIPNAGLLLYKGMGHPAVGKKFAGDVLDFLNEDII